MSDEMNICADCRHCTHPHRGAIWYEYKCEFLEREKGIDPVSGVEGYLVQNDIGLWHWGGDRYPYCRDRNKTGECADFEGARDNVDKAKSALKEIFKL